MAFDAAQIRRQFPFFDQPKAPVFLDSAATTQKPKAVLDAVSHFYAEENGTAYRGLHPLTEEATRRFEDARRTVAAFIGAPAPESVVFTKSATEGLNLIARSLGDTWKPGDIVVLTMLEHHSNIVPWLQLRERRGIEICWLECDASGQLDLTPLDAALATGRTRLVSVTAQSNVLGVRPDTKEIIRRAHRAGALVCVDAAQAIAHERLNVTELGADLLVFSAHKLFAPVGLGVLYGTPAVLKAMPPFIGGGGMVQDVTRDTFVAADPPLKFEAGTLPIADAVGLDAAIQWLQQWSPTDITVHESALLHRADAALRAIPGLTVLGPTDPALRHGCLSFMIAGLHPHDLSELLSAHGLCVRSGHLCAKPLHAHLGITASTRLSVSLYNTPSDIDTAVTAIEKAARHWRS